MTWQSSKECNLSLLKRIAEQPTCFADFMSCILFPMTITLSGERDKISTDFF